VFKEQNDTIRETPMIRTEKNNHRSGNMYWIARGGFGTSEIPFPICLEKKLKHL